MSRRVLEFSLFVLFSCAAPNPGSDDAGFVDAGSTDAGDADAGLVCEEGQVPGPLGTCVDAPCSQAGGSCLGRNGCCNGMSCQGPADPSGCGICQRMEDQCDTERPCDDGFTCATHPPPSCSCDGSSWTSCQPTCSAGSCGEDESCRDGWCQPRRCDEGFTCPAGFRCESGVREDVRGCGVVACESSSACPTDAPRCVNGVCQVDVGHCMLPVP